MVMAKFCRKCGQPMPEDSLFCGNCGAKVEEAPEAQAKETQQSEHQPEEKPQPKTDAAARKADQKALQSAKRKSNAVGCLIAFCVLLVIGLVSCGISMLKISESDVDDAFLLNMDANLGTQCTFTFSDHLAYFEEGLQEYIGKGSFTTAATGDAKYTYNYRAYYDKEAGKIVFGKIDVYDPTGTQIIDYYNEAEVEYYDSLEVEGAA